MKTLLVFFVLGFIGSFFKPGEPVPAVEVFLEQEGSTTPVAFQHTGDNGKATFANLPKGLYRIKVVLPRQSGKLMRGKDNINCQLLVGYHNEKQEYFLREDEGFFTICYSQLKKVSNKNVTPVYNLEKDKNNKMVEVGKFEVGSSNGSITMEIRAQKPKAFEKKVAKVRDDVQMVTIKNIS